MSIFNNGSSAALPRRCPMCNGLEHGSAACATTYAPAPADDGSPRCVTHGETSIVYDPEGRPFCEACRVNGPNNPRAVEARVRAEVAAEGRTAIAKQFTGSGGSIGPGLTDAPMFNANEPR